jgi:hypothetical protein
MMEALQQNIILQRFVELHSNFVSIPTVKRRVQGQAVTPRYSESWHTGSGVSQFRNLHLHPLFGLDLGASSISNLESSSSSTTTSTGIYILLVCRFVCVCVFDGNIAFFCIFLKNKSQNDNDK